jgi:hypothetical protein
VFRERDFKRERFRDMSKLKLRYRDGYVELETVRKILFYSVNGLSSLPRLVLVWEILQVYFQTLTSTRTFMDCAPFLIFSAINFFREALPRS